MDVVSLMKVVHIVSEWPKLAQKEYKQVRHDNIAKNSSMEAMLYGDSVKQGNGT